MDCIIKNVSILTMEKDIPEILENMNIFIKDGVIEKIWNNKKDLLNNLINADLEKDVNIEIFDGNKMLVMPGLINTHVHTGMSLFRGYKDDLELMEWLNNVILPKEKIMSEEDIYWCSLLSCIEMIKSGTTCFADMYFKYEKVVEAIKKIGIRAFLSWSICDDNIDNVIPSAKEYLSTNKKMDDLINLGFSLHSPYTCNSETIKKVLDAINEEQKVLQIHLAETKREVEIIKEKYKKTPTEYLNDNGLLNKNTLLAHGIYLSDEDIKIIHQKGCSISHNPISNCKLASGICDVIKLKNNGINVSIGTDGQGSTTTLDMFEEMRLTGYLQKIKNEDSTIIKAYDILKMATVNGAKALQSEELIGSIATGKKADLIFIDLNEVNLQPNNDITSNLVYSANASNVKHVMINGKFVMKNRIVLNINEEEIKEKVRQISKNIL